MFNGKSILITGGTGSFGKKFIETVLLNYNPKRLIVYSRDEFKQFNLKNDISKKFPDKSNAMRYFIGDVRDKERLLRAFNGVDYVIHAAAMKQVVTCEYNPFEAVKTNINGAQNVIEAALDAKVKKVVALSTDKSVNPINLYGGTKLVSDKLFVFANAYAGGVGTIFSIVRYGNVAGSRGSVIPLFKDILASGNLELPITDTRMTRFYITMEKAIELVFKAIELSKGGETYISKIPSFKILDLAKALNENYKIKEVGIREGEKIHEIMITSDDSINTYEYDDYYIIFPYLNFWGKGNYNHQGGKLVKPGFEYSSDKNAQWFSVDDLRREIGNLNYE